MKILNYEKLENRNVILKLSLTIDEFDESYAFCSDCGNVVDIDSAVEYDGSFYCNDCVEECSCCHQLIPNSALKEVDDSSYLYCPHCWNEETYTCHACGTHFRYDDSLYEGADGEYYCEECIDEHNNSCLDDYHTMKNEGHYDFYGEEKRIDAPYLGVEIEVDANQYVSLTPIVEHIIDMWGNFIHQEHDGSLEYGFENITMPASLSYHLSVMDKYNDTFDYLLHKGLKGHDIGTAGIHVHIDRTFFGSHQDTAIAKLLFIFERFRDELKTFSRRTDYQLDRWARSRKNEEGAWIKKTVKEAREYPHYQDRYHSVNLCNTDTIEIRIFRSTLNTDTFEAILRFVNRLAVVAKNTRAVEIASMSFEDLIGDDTCVKSYWNKVKGGSF